MILTSGNYGGFRKTISECCKKNKYIFTSNIKVNNNFNIIFSEKQAKIITHDYDDNLKLIQNNNNIYILYGFDNLFKRIRKIIQTKISRLGYSRILELVSDDYFFKYYNNENNNKTFEIIPLTLDDLGVYPFFYNLSYYNQMSETARNHIPKELEKEINELSLNTYYNIYEKVKKQYIEINKIYKSTKYKQLDIDKFLEIKV